MPDIAAHALNFKDAGESLPARVWTGQSLLGAFFQRRRSIDATESH